MGTLKVGIIGCGIIAAAHASSLKALREAGLVDVEIAAVHDVEAPRAEAFAQYFGAVPAATMEDVAAASDAVYVCTPTNGHLEAVRAAACARRPIFCEKPLARSLKESLSLAGLAAEAGVPVQVGLVLRSAPVYRRLVEIVGSGRFGRPMAVVARDDQFFPTQGHYSSTWRSDASIAGSGTLLEHSIHDIDILQACFGPVVTVSASVGFFGGNEGIEDSASALLRTGDGLAISLVSVWHQVLTRPSTRRVEVLFEDAFVSLDDDFIGPITVQTSQGSEVIECPAAPFLSDIPLPGGEIGLAVRPYVEENRDFVESLARGDAPAPGLGEALSAHRVVDACYRSAEQGGAPLSPLSPVS